MFLLAVITLCVALYYAIVGIISLITGAFCGDNDTQQDSVTVVAPISPQQLRETHLMSARLDSLMARPMALDTNNIAVSVYDLTTDTTVYNLHASQLLPPASCMKIITAVTAVKQLGLNHVYRESLLVRGTMKGDTLVGNLLLKADDDPLCETLDPLVKRLHRSGIRHIRGNVYLALAREDTLTQHPTAKAWDIPYHKVPLLLKGKRYVERTLLYTLSINGITYRKDTSVNPKDKQYRSIATTAHRLRDVLTPMVIHSSNVKADAVFYHLDYKASIIRDRRMAWTKPHATERLMQKLFAANDTTAMRGFVFNDGSGLSPDNRLTASFLVDVLKYAYNDKTLRDYFINEAMASPGDPERHGSLLTRMSQPQYRGRLFCKTGTMVTVGTSSLAGYLHGSDNHWYVFSIINTDSPVAESRIFQDRLCKLMMAGK